MTDDEPTSNVDAGARAVVRQRHGGALRPFQKGNGDGKGPAAGAARNGAPIREWRKRVRDYFVSGSAETMERLWELQFSDDERVSVIAIQEINNRVWGRVGDNPAWGAEDDGAGTLDLSTLTPEERADVTECVRRLKRYTALARERAAGIERPEV
jgi:hypothetical protein